MKPTHLRLIHLFLIAALLASTLPQPAPAVGQTTGQTYILNEDFTSYGGVFWTPQSNPLFNHSFTMASEWDSAGQLLEMPTPPSPPYNFTLYAGNEDRITFNLPSATASVTEAQVWGWASPAINGGKVGRGRVVFEGTGDEKTFTFVGTTPQWTLFKASETDTGDNGRVLGAIVAVRLKDMGGLGSAGPFFDSLRVVAVTPPRRSNLALTMGGPASPLTPGATATYNLTVTNTGPEDAPSVVIEDTLPYAGTFVPGGSSSACQLVNERVRCDLGTLASGASRTVTIAVQVGSSVCATFANRATVTAQAHDANLADNTVVHTATTSNPACADYSVELTAWPVPVDPEADFTYALTVSNAGPDTAGATITANLPNQVFPTSTLTDPGVTCSGSHQITCTVAPLAPGQQAQVFVTAHLSIVATGLLETTASVTPTVSDPRTENNATRFRFTGGTAYTYTLIAEAGVGALANYDGIRGVAMNENGEVAFWASHENGVDANNRILYDEWAAFVGDGTTTTKRFGLTDLAPVTAPAQQRWGSCLAINDAGWLAALTYVDVTTGATYEMTANTLHLIDPNGARTQLASASSAVDGPAFERFRNAALNNSNEVLTIVTASTASSPASLALFAGGQRTELYRTNRRIDVAGLNDLGDFAYVEAPVDWWVNHYELWVKQRTASGIFGYDILQHDSRPSTGWANFGMTLNNHRQVAYSQLVKDPNTGVTTEYLHAGYAQPVISWTSLAQTTQYGHRVYETGINDQGRYAYYGSISATNNNKLGIFTGPNFLANRVVAFSSTVNSGWGTYLLDSTAHDDYTDCTIPINNAGQIAFAALLDNGRIVVMRAEPTRDNDGDGVTDWDELGGPNSGDGNGDNIPDSVQPNVASVTNPVDGRVLTFATDPNFTLVNARSVPNPSPGNAPADPFPFGHFAFEITDLPPGGSATVTVQMPWNAIASWWKYGPTPNNPTPHWYDFAFDGATGADINGAVVTLHFVDGARGDSDLTANGTIVDPGGPLAYPHVLNLPTVLR